MGKDVAEGVDFFLDITTDVCPMTFVKTKLLIERMSSGQTAEVRLNAGEPLENVPRAVEEHGHTVLSLVPEGAGGGVYLLRLRKS
ncbi:MAG: sulfurtransferase TusA family protein [Alphaproteobacteria bacterium]